MTFGDPAGNFGPMVGAEARDDPDASTEKAKLVRCVRATDCVKQCRGCTYGEQMHGGPLCMRGARCDTTNDFRSRCCCFDRYTVARNLQNNPWLDISSQRHETVVDVQTLFFSCPKN